MEGTCYLATFDEDAFRSAWEKVLTRGCQTQSGRDSAIEVVVPQNSAASQLMLTIPYDRGWQVKVDGRAGRNDVPLWAVLGGRPGAGCAYGGAALRAARADSRCGDKRSVADGIGRVANRRFQKAQTEMRKRTWLRQGEVMRMAITYSRTLLGPLQWYSVLIVTGILVAIWLADVRSEGWACRATR